jgi:hypothetical protein
MKDLIPTISQLREEFSFFLPFLYKGNSVLSSDTKKADELFDSISLK